MSLLQQKSWRGWVVIPLSVMILCALLLAQMAQAGTSSCAAPPSAASTGIGDAGGPTLDARDGAAKQAMSHGKFACCSFACSFGVIAAGTAANPPEGARQGTAVLSDQTPETLVADGLKRPPRRLAADHGRA